MWKMCFSLITLQKSSNFILFATWILAIYKGLQMPIEVSTNMHLMMQHTVMKPHSSLNYMSCNEQRSIKTVL